MAKSAEGKCKIVYERRNVKRGIYFLNEDLLEMSSTADEDLIPIKTVPWRRIYGPCMNGGFVDLTLLATSWILVALLTFENGLTLVFFSHSAFKPALLLAGIIAMYAVGELDRRKPNLISELMIAPALLFFLRSLMNCTTLEGLKILLSSSLSLTAIAILCIACFIAVLITRRSVLVV